MRGRGRVASRPLARPFAVSVHHRLPSLRPSPGLYETGAGRGVAGPRRAIVDDPGIEQVEADVARLVFRGGNVFDGTGSAPRAADVAVEDGRIVEVGTGSTATTRSSSTARRSCRACSTATSTSRSATSTRSRLSRTPTSVRFLEAARNMEATLRAGITSVRDAGGADMGRARRAERPGAGPADAGLASMLSQTGGHGDDWLPSGDRMTLFGDLPGLPDTIVDGPDEMRQVVRELIRNGADVIKVATSGGVLSPLGRPRHAHFRPAELDVLVEEATAAGRFVMAHAQGADGIKNAVRAGIRSIEHGIYLDDEAIELMLGARDLARATLVAPLGVLEAVDAASRCRRRWSTRRDRSSRSHRASFRRAVEAGVQDRDGHRLGDHAARPQPARARADGRPGGMTPEAVLEATTRSAARLLGVDGGPRHDRAGQARGPRRRPGRRDWTSRRSPTRIEAVYQAGALVA